MLKTVSQQIKLQRLEICNSCEHLVKKFNSCKLCKCYVPAKTMFASAICPDNKWLEESASNDLVNQIEESILKMWNNSK
mgnify:CR=1 FL=1